MIDQIPKDILAIDPGKSTGWCWLKEGIPVWWGISRDLNEWIDFLEGQITPNLVVMEDFRLFSWKAKEQSGSRMEVTQAMGATEYWARTRGTKIILSSPRWLPIAQMHSGVKLNKNHNDSHHESAFNHAFEWMIRQGYVNPVGM